MVGPAPPAQFGDDWVADSLNLLLLIVEFLNFSKLVGIEPLNSFITLVIDFLHVIFRDLVLHLLILNGSLHVETVALQSVLGGDPLLLLLIICLEFLSIVHHTLNFLLRKATLVVGDGDLILLASALVTGRDVEDTISINVESNLDLRNSSWGRGDSS